MHLNAIASRGHQAVLRFYVDYPGRPSGIPAYLLRLPRGADPRLRSTATRRASRWRRTTTTPEMMSMLTGFISALGQQYDGDPRLAFITHGLVGF